MGPFVRTISDIVVYIFWIKKLDYLSEFKKIRLFTNSENSKHEDVRYNL